MKRLIIGLAFLLPVLTAGGCAFRADPAAPNGKVVVSNCTVCRLVWTAAGWKTECPTTTAPDVEE